MHYKSEWINWGGWGYSIKGYYIFIYMFVYCTGALLTRYGLIVYIENHQSDVNVIPVFPPYKRTDHSIEEFL